MSRRVCPVEMSAVLAVMGLWACATQANVIIDTVPVGDVGNAPDTRYTTPGYGSVGYTYDIGKYEVTAGQYTVFLNAVAATDPYELYNPRMDRTVDPIGCDIKRSGSPGSYTYGVTPDRANRPVNLVSYWDACRFANWLHNGQPTGAEGPGTTETGAYPLNGYNSFDGRTIRRNAGWKWAVTSENEWYKAAYYKGGSTNAGYWDYATRSDMLPGRDMADVSGNNANYYGTPYPIDPPYNTTLVGEFQNSVGPYGTFDQTGNVYEWNEGIAYEYLRVIRGGSYGSTSSPLHASYRNSGLPNGETGDLGFRVSEIPEPATVGLLILGFAPLLARRRSRALRGNGFHTCYGK